VARSVIGREAYDPRAVRVGRPPLFVDNALCIEFLNYLAAPQAQGGKGDSAGHLADTRCALRFWRDHLPGRDLRTLSEDEVRLPPGERGYTYKTKALKSLLSWLRKVRVGNGLAKAEGPDERLLVLPQARGFNLHDPKLALARRQKETRALNGYFKVRAHLVREASSERPPLQERAVRSREEARLFLLALDVLAATGWHVRELERWIKLGGVTEPMPEGREEEAAAVLWTTHKRGTEHRTAVSAEGIAVERKRIARLMREQELAADDLRAERQSTKLAGIATCRRLQPLQSASRRRLPSVRTRVRRPATRRVQVPANHEPSGPARRCPARLSGFAGWHRGRSAQAGRDP